MWLNSPTKHNEYLQFILSIMSVVGNDSRYIHWHQDMDCVSPPKTHREPIHGGSNPASMRDTVFDGDTQSMPLKKLWVIRK